MTPFAGSANAAYAAAPAPANNNPAAVDPSTMRARFDFGITINNRFFIRTSLRGSVEPIGPLA
jgi:hypothetical protein